MNSSPLHQPCLTLITNQFFILHFGSQTGRLPIQVDGEVQLPASVTKQTSVRVLIVSVNIVRSTYHRGYPSPGNALLWWMLDPLQIVNIDIRKPQHRNYILKHSPETQLEDSLHSPKLSVL
jgi:hypothetical protein